MNAPGRRRCRLTAGVAARFALLLALLVPLEANAETRYVATSGNDTNAGTMSSPWRTLGYALSRASCGDLIYVRAGTYASINTQAVPATSCSSFSSAITMQAYPSEAVHLPSISVFAERYLIFQDLILDGQPNGYPGATLTVAGGHASATGAGYLRFINLNVHGPNTVPVPVWFGTVMVVSLSQGSVGYNEFIGGSVHDATYGDPAAPQGMHGFYVESPYNVIDGVEIFNVDGYGITNYGEGTYLPANNTYRNNFLHNCGKPGASVFAIGLGSGNNNKAYNNVIARCTNGITQGTSGNGSQIDNNTLYGLTGAAPTYRYPAITASGGTGHTIRNNIVFGNIINAIDSSGAMSTIVSNNLTSDPSFVNAAANDFRLQSQSIAINAGATLSFIAADFVGVGRPQNGAFDIGAFEYLAAGTTAPRAASSPVFRRIN